MQQPHEPNITEYKRGNFTVRIRPTIKDGKQYFIADFTILGKRRLVWRSSLAKARQAASEAVDAMDAGQAEVLLLTAADRHAYLRACEALRSIEAIEAIDTACGHYAEAMAVLGGKTSILDACRDWIKRNDVAVPKKSVGEAADDCLASARSDGKKKDRVRKLETVFNRFKTDLSIPVSQVTPALVSQWLAGLELSERTRKNYRDAIGYLSRWCVLRGYLAKGSDWLEGVQNYSARKLSEIEIFSPAELERILAHTEEGMLPFVAIQAFGGLRHAEVTRLSWNEIDLEDGFIEVKAIHAKTGERRLVPIHENLKQWLLPHRKIDGKVCRFANVSNQIVKIVAASGVAWKHNGLRHSFISYRVAESADVPRVSDEAGNSVSIIRQHYLRRVKPAEAARWFGITPASIWPDNVKGLPTAEVAA